MNGKAQQSGGSRSSKPKSKFVTQYEEATAAMKLLAEYNKDMNNFGSFVEEKECLEEKLRKTMEDARTKEKEFSKDISLKDKEIAKLQNNNAVLVEAFGAELVSLRNGAKTQSDLEALVKDLEQELRQAKSAFHAAQREATKLKGVVEGRDASLTKINESLKLTQTTLKSKILEMDGTRNELERCQIKLEKEKAVMDWAKIDERHQFVAPAPLKV